MKRDTIALFGEAERGEFRHGYMLDSLSQVLDALGEPPENSRGLHLAIQSILYERHVLFFRVEEEGFSLEDYYLAMNLLAAQGTLFPRLLGICAPGLGDARLIKRLIPLCEKTNSLLIVNESDLYDYLTY